MNAQDPTEKAYLETRYTCEALRILLRRSGYKEKAKALSSAMKQLCAELRAHLARQGRDRVASTFDPSLLQTPITTLLEDCRAKAERLYRQTGSKAARIIIETIGN